MIHAHPTMKLGRRGGPSTRHSLAMATFLDKTKLQAPPLAFDVGGPDTIGMYANDRLGDCTCATWAGIFVHDAAAHGESIDFTPDAVVEMYRASGYSPGDSSTDNGWTLADAASYAERVGLVDTADIVRKTGPWMQVDHVDLTEVRLALFMFGAMPTGVDLPLSAQNQEVWDTDGGDDDQQKPGGWGGHSLTLLAADHDGGWFRTWGRRKRFTWRWYQRYVDEAICKVDPLWCSGDRPAPDGFLLDDLQHALTVLR